MNVYNTGTFTVVLRFEFAFVFQLSGDFLWTRIISFNGVECCRHWVQMRRDLLPMVQDTNVWLTKAILLLPTCFRPRLFQLQSSASGLLQIWFGWNNNAINIAPVILMTSGNSDYTTYKGRRQLRCDGRRKPTQLPYLDFWSSVLSVLQNVFLILFFFPPPTSYVSPFLCRNQWSFSQ